MGEPVIIWPPDGGNYDYGDNFTSVCESYLGANWYDCTDEVQGGTGLACCPY